MDPIGCRFHLVLISPDDKFCAAADYNNNIHLIDITDDEAPKTMSVVNTGVGIMYDGVILPDNKTLIVCSGEPVITVFAITKGSNGTELVKQKELSGHSGSVPWSAMTADGKYFLTRSYTETIIWDSSTLNNIVIIQESVAIGCGGHKYATGLFHDNCYKRWRPNVISDFTDEF